MNAAAIVHPALVEVSDLAFSYGDRPVLRGVSLAIPRGKIVAILGATASGKSTLLALIGGQLQPQRGSVKIEGKDVHALSTSELYRLRRRIGMMFQAGGLFSDLSVFENIAFPLREHTKLSNSLIREIVLMKLQAVGLRGARDLMPNEVSGGMSRRIALARAIAMDPMLTMYDEPFAGLDPISLNQIAGLIRDLNGALGATSIVVSYDVNEAQKLADYIYLLGDGVVAASGTPAELKASTDPFVRQFMDAKPDGPIPFNVPAPPFAAQAGIHS
jgi:phospholipid/cholesterol/gamma-HCH transport system ATP-binding protein